MTLSATMNQKMNMTIISYTEQVSSIEAAHLRLTTKLIEFSILGKLKIDFGMVFRLLFFPSLPLGIK